MAYMDRGNSGNRDSHGWAVAAGFAGQAAIIVSIVGLLSAGGSSAVAPQSPVASPVLIKPGPPAYSALPDVQPMIPYEVTLDGQTGGDVFPNSSAVPTFTVKPGQDLTASLDVQAALSAPGISVSLIGPSSGNGSPDIRTPYNDSVQAQSPGTYVYQLSWPGSASELQPGTQWTLVMSATSPNQVDTSPIAIITVAP
jgi:hypothetical protein